MNERVQTLTTNAADDDFVDPFPVVALQCGISESTLSRLVKDGHGPKVVLLSQRRKGVRRRDKRDWLASRTR